MSGFLKKKEEVGHFSFFLKFTSTVFLRHNTTGQGESLKYLLFSLFSKHFQIKKKKKEAALKKEAGRDAKHKLFFYLALF